MKVRLFGCRRFGRLLNEREDRDLKPAEVGFMERHRTVCPSCRKEEVASTLSLNMLRAAALEPMPAAHFDERVMRRLRVQQVREGIGYWSPALVGGAIACIALFVALHMLTVQTIPSPTSVPAGEARRSDMGWPNLSRPNLPSFNR